MRGWIYDRTLRPLTAKWYKLVLERLEPGSHLLDVGIGTGGALARNADVVRARNLRITGVDIDADYLRRCRRLLRRVGLEDRVEVLHRSILEHGGGPYDAAYFSASFMLMPEPVAVLRHVMRLLQPEARIYFTQTFSDKRSRFLEWAKPRLHKITTMHFGRVTYEADFRQALAEAGVELLELTTLKQIGKMSHRLAVARLGAGPGVREPQRTLA
ncbi:MAG: hypothetical protein KatS3mg102_2615 [Planctomycetota bacterium]|nr:MAG: hypothetical protein KatS3mg102_2615 [Planctomycetota bacterium]